MNKKCTYDDHTTRRQYSEFDNASGLKIHYKPGQRNKWEGNVEVKEVIGSDSSKMLSLTRQIDRSNGINRSFDATIELPSCDYGCSTTSAKVFALNYRSDDYPGETSWKLKNECTGEIMQTGLAHGWKMCVDASQKYTFTIQDAEGDGICCDYGIGEYKVFYDGVLIKQGGVFGSAESTTFGADSC